MAMLDPFDYQDGAIPSILGRLLYRIELQPINGWFLLCFVLAIFHAFLAPYLKSYALRLGAKEPGHIVYKKKQKAPFFFPQMLLFLSEIEVVFGLWCIPCLLAIVYVYGHESMLKYLAQDDHHDPVFITLAMCVASTAPILRFAEKGLYKIANWGDHTPLAWWFTIQLIGPLLGSLLKETVAMTIAASLIGTHFFAYKPPKKLAYLSIGLLFTNISIAGLITNFAATPMTLLKKAWGWDAWFMFSNFGWKSMLAICLSTIAVYSLCKSDFLEMDQKQKSAPPKEPPYIPWWIVLVHVIVLGWIIWVSDSAAIAFGSFVLFLGFYQATASYQSEISLREPILVGFFIGSIIVLGGLQGWWIAPIVEGLNNGFVTLFGLGLSAVNQNASVVYIATQIPDINPEKKYLFIASIMAGGGLTYLSNTPNLIGYSLLGPYFEEPISPLKQLKGALLPALIAVAIFVLFHG